VLFVFLVSACFTPRTRWGAHHGVAQYACYCSSRQSGMWEGWVHMQPPSFLGWRPLFELEHAAESRCAVVLHWAC
jgi:hypothetical protein